MARIAGLRINIVFVFLVVYVFFKVLDLVIPLRVKPEHELEGLDQHEVGVSASTDFALPKPTGKTRRTP